MLVGTASIESSERLSAELNRRKIAHNVLNAKQHEREADSHRSGGQTGRLTIATNMAGRGTDIVLGGNWEAESRALETPTRQVEQIKSEWQERHEQVIEAGGLHIIGTERTNPGVSTTSCAAGPVVRVIPGRAASTCLWKTT